MAKLIQVSSQTQQKVVNAYLKGVTLRMLIEQFCLSRKVVLRIIKAKQARKNKAYTESDKDNIVALYLAGESTNNIATRLNTSTSFIYKMIESKGLIRRGKRVGEEVRSKILADYTSGLSSTILAQKYGVAPSFVVCIANTAGIIRSPNKPSSEQIQQMITLYETGKTSYQIGDELGFSGVTVQKYINETGKMRNASYKKERNKAILAAYNSGKSSTEVASEFGVNQYVVQKVARANGCARGQKGVDFDIKVSVLDMMEKGVIPESIASILSIKIGIVYRVAMYANKPKRLGELAPAWEGGKNKISKSIRGLGKYLRWRVTIFRRDNYQCQFCGFIGEKDGRQLHADHIYPFAAILDDHKIESTEQALECPDLWDTSNGRTLCISCHEKTPTYMNGAKEFLRNRKQAV